MPIIVTFDIQNPAPQELNRIRGFFERLGWEHLGNTAYRYPKLHGQHPTEDWFNHVIPALMMLRAFARQAAATGRNIRKFSLDVQSSTGFNPHHRRGNASSWGRTSHFLAPVAAGAGLRPESA